MRRSLLLATAALVVAVAATPAAAQPSLTPPIEPPTKSGLFRKGISLELAPLGMIEARTSDGHAIGLDLQIAFAYQLGLHWALRMPVEIGVTATDPGQAYAEGALVPGVLYRFRTDPDQHGVPYVGGGVRVGAAMIGNTLVGRPLVVACCHTWGGGGHHDPNVNDKSIDSSAPSPELWVGYEWNRTRWFALQLDAALAYERLLATNVLVARETFGIRVTF